MTYIVVLKRMVVRHWVGRLRGDRAFVIGLCGGTVTSLAGIVAYVLVPYLQGSASGFGTPLVDGAVAFTGVSPLVHVVVLVVVPFVTTTVAVTVAHRRGLSTRSHDLKVVGSIVLVPVATVIVLYFVGAVTLGLWWALGGVGDALYERFFTAVGITGFALIFGLFFMFAIAAAVLVGELLGAGSGYLLARRLSRR
jgi:hypothetical protein